MSGLPKAWLPDAVRERMNIDWNERATKIQPTLGLPGYMMRAAHSTNQKHGSDCSCHYVLNFYFLPCFRFFISQMTTLKQYHWAKYRKMDQVIFLIPKRLVYVIFNSLQWPKPNFSLPFEGITSKLVMRITKNINWEMLFCWTS